MRIDARRRTFMDRLRSVRFECYLDGRKLRDSFDADDRAGYAVCYWRDEHGNYRVVNGEIATVRCEGYRVEFRPVMSLRAALVRVLAEPFWARWHSWRLRRFASAWKGTAP